MPTEIHSVSTGQPRRSNRIEKLHPSQAKENLAKTDASQLMQYLTSRDKITFSQFTKDLPDTTIREYMGKNLRYRASRNADIDQRKYRRAGGAIQTQRRVFIKAKLDNSPRISERLKRAIVESPEYSKAESSKKSNIAQTLLRRVIDFQIRKKFPHKGYKTEPKP